jgi:hypothetical protein
MVQVALRKTAAKGFAHWSSVQICAPGDSRFLTPLARIESAATLYELIDSVKSARSGNEKCGRAHVPRRADAIIASAFWPAPATNVAEILVRKSVVEMLDATHREKALVCACDAL